MTGGGIRRKWRRRPGGRRQRFAQVPALLLFFSRHGRRWRRRCWRCGCRCRRLRRRIAAHAVLEFTHALPQALHHLGNLTTPEKHEDHNGDDQKMHWAVKHRNLPFAPGRTRQAPQTYHLRRMPPSLSLAAQPPTPPKPLVSGYSITRSSPARRVTCSRSRCSSSGIAYLRLIPASSLNAVIGRRLPFSLLYLASNPRSSASASR